MHHVHKVQHNHCLDNLHVKHVVSAQPWHLKVPPSVHHVILVQSLQRTVQSHVLHARLVSSLLNPALLCAMLAPSVLQSLSQQLAPVSHVHLVRSQTALA